MFGVSSGKFLGFLLTQRRINVSQDQVRAFRNLPQPKSLKDIEKLTRRVAALGKFISRSTEKCLPFYNLLRGNKKFVWEKKCEEAFEKFKEYLSKSLILSKLIESKILFLYLAISDHAVSRVLVQEEEWDHKQIYYVSKSLVQAEIHYVIIENLILALITSVRKLRPYFQYHPIRVVTTFPLKTILQKPDLSRWVAK